MGSDHVGEQVANVYRGEDVEATHCASIAVVNNEGTLTHYLGDPHFVSMARSSIKPFQLLPLIVSGGADHFGFTDRQLSVMCGSHNGTDEHREVVLSNLRQCGLGAEDLQCGAHWPLFMQVQEIHPQNNEDKDPLRHNCSGKHSGFLALAGYLGEDTAKYLDPSSRTQVMARDYVCRMTGFSPDRMKISVDGCSAPNFSQSPFSLAVGFMRLATEQGDKPEVNDALAKVRKVMTAYPELFSGEGRFDLDLMRSFPGKIFCKVGAEGLEGIGFSDHRIGIGIKIHDGNKRALIPVIIEVLVQLGVIANIEDYPYLKGNQKPEVRNARKIVTGHVVVDFKLRSA